MARPLLCFTAVCVNHTCRQGIAYNITPSRHSTPDLKIDCVMCLYNAIPFVLNKLLIYCLLTMFIPLYSRIVLTDIQKYAVVTSLTQITALV